MKKKIQKTITILLICLFLWNQLVWAYPARTLRPVASKKSVIAEALAKTSSAGSIDQKGDDSPVNLEEVRDTIDREIKDIVLKFSRKKQVPTEKIKEIYLPFSKTMVIVVSSLVKEYRIDDLVDILDYFNKKVYTASKIAKVIKSVLEPIYYTASTELLTRAKAEDGESKRDILLKQAENFAKKGIESFRNLKRAGPDKVSAYTALRMLYEYQKRDEELMALAQEAILNGLHDIYWCTLWMTTLTDFYIKSKNERYDEKTHFLAEVLYKLDSMIKGESTEPALLLSDIYVERYFYKPRLMKKAIGMLEKVLSLIEADDSVGELEQLRMKSKALCRLAIAHASLRSVKDCEKALHLFEQALEYSLDRPGVRGLIWSAKRSLAYLLMKEDEERAMKLFAELKKEFADYAKSATEEDAQSPHTEEVLAWVDYGNVNIEYLKGNFAEVEKEYERLCEEAKGELVFPILYDYIDILLNFKKEQDAKKILLELFRYIGEAETKGVTEDAILKRSYFLYRDRLKRILDFIERELSTPDTWQDADPLALEYMLRFLLTYREYSEEEIDKLCWRFLNYLTEKQPGIDFWPNIKAVILVFSSTPSMTAITFIRHAIRLCDDEPLKDRLESYLRKEACEGCYTLDDYLFFLALNTIAPCLENEDFMTAECNNALDAHFTENNDDPKVLFGIVENAAENMEEITGKNFASVIAYTFLLHQITFYIEQFYLRSEKEKDFMEKIKNVLLDFNRRSRDVFKLFDERPGIPTLDFYDNLSDLFIRLKEYRMAMDIYKKIFRLFDGPDKILALDCGAFGFLGRYATILMYIGKDKESGDMFNSWIKSANAFLDKAEAGQQLPEGISKKELYHILLSSICDLDSEVLIRASMVNEDLKTTTARIIDNYPDNRRSYDDIVDINACAYMSRVFLNDDEKFEKFMIKSNLLREELDIPNMHVSFWDSYRQNILGYIYAEKGVMEAAEETFKAVKEALESILNRKHLEPADLITAKLIGNILKKDYDNAIADFEKERSELEEVGGDREEELYFLLPIFLAVAYNSSGRREEAVKLLEETIESEAKRWRVSKNRNREIIINKSKFVYPVYIRMLPEEFRKPLVELLYEELFKDGLSDEAAGIILNMLLIIDCEYVVSMLIEHFETILTGDSGFNSKRDLRLIRWLASVPTHKRLIIDELCQKLAGSNNVDKSFKKQINKARMQKGAPPAKPEDYPLAVRYLYDNGQFRKALSLIKQGILLAQRQNQGNVIKELQDLQSEIQSAFNTLERLRKAYEADNYNEALSACAELLENHPKNSFALHTQENITHIKQAKGFFEEADIDKASESLEAAPHEDKKIRHLRHKLDTLSDTTQKASSLLDENRYLEAGHKLSKLPDKIMGILIDPESVFLKDLYTGIKECKDRVAEHKRIIQESDSIHEIYENTQHLLHYPEHKDDTFKLLIQRSTDIYNQGSYKHAFNIARLIYELRDYKPDENYLKKAQHIISHTLSSFWMPKLTDDYFIVKTMATAEAYRDERDRRTRHLRKDAPISFEFDDFRLTSKGFVISGFREIDIEKFAFSGDTFRIKPKTQEEELQPIFKLSAVVLNRQSRKYDLVFQMPAARDGYDYITYLLETSLAGGGTITRVTNASWVNQCNMLDYMLKSLKSTTRQRLKADKDDFSLATTYQKTLDRSLGILLDIPKDREQQDKSKEEILVDEQQAQEQITLDPEQKKALIDGLNEEIPSSLYQGPGGTGKTFVITWLTKILLNLKKRVRILSQSNAGVDNIGKKLVSDGIFFARVGNNDDAIAAEIIKIWKDREDRIVSIRDGFKPNLILATINGFYSDNNIQLNPSLLKADVIIVDESSRATVPESLWALYKWQGVKKFIFVGDHYQLPAYGIAEEDVEFAVKEFREKSQGELKIQGFGNRPLGDIFNSAKIDEFRRSLLEKVLQLFDDESGIYQVTRPNFHFFKVNRRSGKYIVKLDNYFYQGRLIPGREVDGILIEDDYNQGIDDYNQRFKEDKLGPKQEDTINKKEITRVIEWLNKLLNETSLDTDDIAVITPYKKQVELIKDTLLRLAKIFEILNDKTRDIDQESLEELLKDNHGIIKLYLEQLHGKDAITKLNQMLKDPKAEDLLQFLSFGDRFIPSELLEKNLFSVTTVDSAIGSEWKAVIISWVRSNFRNGKGSVGFLAKKIDGWKRRNVGMGRAQRILVNVWDKKTFKYATVPEIRDWADYNIKVFDEARENSCADINVYHDMFEEDDLAEPAPIEINQKSLTAIAAQA